MGAKVYFCPNGTVIDDDDNEASKTVAPSDPTITSSLGWTSIGKILTASPELNNKEIELEGFSDELDDSDVFGYEKETITIQDTKNYKFTTKYISLEAFQLSYELLASSGRPYIEGWLHASHFDALSDAGDQALTSCTLYGRLKLTASLGAQSDAATAEYQFDIIKNSLASSSIDDVETKIS